MLTDVFTADTSSLFITILAIVGITGEWRHRTITSSLLAAPDRAALPGREDARVRGRRRGALAADLGRRRHHRLRDPRRARPAHAGGGRVDRARSAATWPWPRCSGGFGLALGSLVRNQPAAIVLILMLGFVIEPTVLAAGPRRRRLRAVQRRCRPRSRTSRPRTWASTTPTCWRPAWAVLAHAGLDRRAVRRRSGAVAAARPGLTGSYIGPEPRFGVGGEGPYPEACTGQGVPWPQRGPRRSQSQRSAW